MNNVIEKLLYSEKIKAHVFVVDRFSYPVHRSRGFCGVKDPRKLGGFSGRFSLYADLKGTRIGDLVFFYQRRIDEPPEKRGFFGIYEIKSDPFFDTEDVSWSTDFAEYTVLGKCPFCESTYPEKIKKIKNGKKKTVWYCSECGKNIGIGKHILPNRILIKPLVYFKTPVDDNTAYVDHTDEGMLWTMLFRKIYGRGRERSINPILPEEAKKMIRLLIRVNKGEINNKVPDFNPYIPHKKKSIEIKLGKGPQITYEHKLTAWIMEHIDKGCANTALKEIIGPVHEIEWFGNEIMYGIGGEKVDLLCLHKRDGIRYKATVFELKRDKISSEAIKQVRRYSYWVAQLVTANAKPRVKKLILQPVIIGYDIEHEALESIRIWKNYSLHIKYPWGSCTIFVEKPVILKYVLKDYELSFSKA